MPPKRITKSYHDFSVITPRRQRVQVKAHPQVVVATQDDYWNDDDDGLFTSHLAMCPRPNVKKKQKIQKEKPRPKKTFPDEEPVEHITRDEEGAGMFQAPEPNDADAKEMLRLQQQLDSFQYKSLSYYDERGARLKVDKGKVIGLHEVQPAEDKRPAAREELVGNFPPTPKNKKKKKKDAKPVEDVAKAHEESIFQKLARSIIQHKQHLSTKDHPKSSGAVHHTFRVFGTPVRQKIYGTHIVPAKTAESRENTIFDQTPIRGTVLLPPHLARLSTLSDFSPRPPQFASTPLDKPKKGRITERITVFDLSDINDADSDSEKGETSKAVETAVDLKYIDSKTEPAAQSGSANASSSKDSGETDEPMEQEAFDPQSVADKTGREVTQTSQNGTFRKAETSMSDVLADSEAEQAEQEATSYSKKRQRTKSPETMCQGVSTMMTVEELPEEKENHGARRITLQPQQKQFLRESRLSVLTTASSRRESLDSLMQDMSIDMGSGMETLGASRLESEGTTRIESRGLATGMTIQMDDTDLIPWYLDGASFTEVPSEMDQLYFLCGNNRKTAWQWNHLPKGALDGRKVKKIGEGSYGEVFATKWGNRDVAVKIVPFEIDAMNRQYTGEYHSGNMQTAADVLPEFVVMSELSKLRDMNEDNSTQNFIELVDAKVVEGLFPKGLLKAWDKYDQSEPGIQRSENTRPDVYSSKHQKFMVFVTENGGIALEDFRLESEHELRSIVLQLMLSMQVAENMLEFEHRDLHLGNVLVKRSKDIETLKYKVNGHDFKLEAHGVKVNIIDFTLSRIHRPPVTVFVDLSKDPSLFEGPDIPQFDVYREMKEFRNNEWLHFEKKTNLMWIEYLALQMIEAPICAEGVISEERKKELTAIFRSLKSYENCSATFVDQEFFNNFYDGYLNH